MGPTSSLTWVEIHSTKPGLKISSRFPVASSQNWQLVRNHSFYFGRIGIAYQHRSAQMALALLVLRRQDVAQVGLRPFYFPGRSLLEALGSASV